MQTFYASCVAIGEKAVLIRGASGSGKSDLALRLIDQGARLVADDQVLLRAAGDGSLLASAPDALYGLIEVRGLGVYRLPAASRVPVALLVDLVSALPERLPEPIFLPLLGMSVPMIPALAFAASTPARLRLALEGTCVVGALAPSLRHDPSIPETTP